jgi:phosphopantothenate-cysteine ligase
MRNESDAQELQRVIVTGGAMSEPIDAVRAITNLSSGELSSKIADQFAQNGYDVTYIHTKGSIMPQLQSHAIEVNCVTELSNTIEQLLSQNAYTAFVQVMAISDYRVDRIEPEIIGNKLPSNLERLTIHLTPNPKVIHQIKHWQPDIKLVGFKLLADVTVAELISTATALNRKNNCEFIVANRLEDIRDSEHHAYFVNNDGQFNSAHTKLEISQKLVQQCCQ